MKILKQSFVLKITPKIEAFFSCLNFSKRSAKRGGLCNISIKSSNLLFLRGKKNLSNLMEKR